MNFLMTARRSLIIVLFFLLVLVCGTTRAQQTTAELTGTVGHFFAGSYTLSGGQIDLEDAPVYGGILDFPASRDVSVELSYSYSKSHSKYYAYYPLPGQDAYDTDVGINYILAGALHEVKKGKVTPFGGVMLGAVFFDPTNPRYSSQWRMAIGFQLGMKFDLGDRLGLRLGGRLLFPLYIYGATVYGGSGGAGYGVSAGIPIVQGDLSAGLSVKF